MKCLNPHCERGRELRLEVEQAADAVLCLQMSPNRTPDAMGRAMMALQSAQLRLQDAELARIKYREG